MNHPSGDLFSPTTLPAQSIRVGIGGWNYAPWRNNFYPAGLIQRRELEYASRQLRTIEINGTYYGAQKPATYAKWAAETPADFMFSLKAPRYIIEGKRLTDTAKGIAGFVHGGLAEFGARPGPILWQLPPSRPFDAADLSAMLEQLPRELNGRPLRHALEVRHPSFLCEAYVQLARTHAVPTVFTDSPTYPSLADLRACFHIPNGSRCFAVVVRWQCTAQCLTHCQVKPRAAAWRPRRSNPKGRVCLRTSRRHRSVVYGRTLPRSSLACAQTAPGASYPEYENRLLAATSAMRG